MDRLAQAIEASALGPADREADGTVSRRYCFAPDFIGFAGHFPGAPIFPGLAQIMTGGALARNLAERPVWLQEVANARFMQQIGPDQEIRVVGRLRTNDPLTVEIRIYLGEVLASSFQLRYADQEAPAC